MSYGDKCVIQSNGSPPVKLYGKSLGVTSERSCAESAIFSGLNDDVGRDSFICLPGIIVMTYNVIIMLYWSYTGLRN